MAKFRCRLCGGKLVNNRCTSCGLDNSCYDRDSSYKKTLSNQRRIEREAEKGMPVLPAHSDAELHKPQPVKTIKSRPINKKTASYTTKIRNRTVWITIIIVMIIIFVSIISSALPVLNNIVGSLTSDNTYADPYSDDYNWSFEDDDPYTFVTRDIPGEGDSYETVLGTGVYQVGIHIPEGIYQAELLEGVGSIYISDIENSIYEYTYFGTDEEYDEVTTADDLRLYTGAQLRVDNGLLIQLNTDNAQPLSEVPYPAASSDSIPLREGSYTAGGKEIPQGIYDISIDVDERDPYGYASIILLYPNGSSEYFWADSPESGVSANGYSSDGVKNVVIPDGTEISVEYGDIILTPGQTCYDVDYTDYPQQ